MASRADRAPVRERVRFRELRYANCWEDAAVVGEALAPLAGAHCLSIASAGDNSLSLLARGAARVLAVDVSLPQLALLELKAAAFAELDHPALLEFLGAVAPPRRRGPSARARVCVYERLRRRLSAAARQFWDARTDAVAAGIVHAGRLERYFRLFRRALLPLAHSRTTIRALLLPRDGPARERFHDEVWDTPRWRRLVRLFFGRRVMGRLGRDPELFRHVEVDVAARVLERTRHALTALPTHDNPYLAYLLDGSFAAALPDYLRPQHHAAIRANLTRLELRQDALEDLAARLDPRSFDAFNLSDVGEYVSAAAFQELLAALLPAAAPGARLAWWNLFVPRQPEGAARTRLEPLPAAAELSRRAQAFFYARLVLERVR